MIAFDEIDNRLGSIGKDRAWLAAVTERSPASIRAALAPNAPAGKRSSLLQKALSDAIAKEEAAQGKAESLPPGFSAIFLSDQEIDAADRAAHAVGAPSLAAFCRDVIQAEARRILFGLADNVVPMGRENVTTLPFHGLVAAGLPAGVIDDLAEDFVAVAGDFPAGHFAVRVHGRSMEPDYPDGSLIVCRPLKDGEFAKKGSDVIASDAAGTYFKRLIYKKDGPKGSAPRKATPRLASINPDFEDVVPISDCPIKAIVVGTANPA